MRFHRTIQTNVVCGLGLALILVLRGVTGHGLVRAHSAAPSGMVWIPPGTFIMGSNAEFARPDEKPAHRVRVDGFWMDTTEVTNRQFRAFVEATGHVTTAEKPVDVDEIMKQMPPGTATPPKERLVPGSLVFTPTSGPVPLDDFS